MEFNAYQTAAARTAREYTGQHIGQLVSALGLGGEAAEVVTTVLNNMKSGIELVAQTGRVTELLKKIHGHGHLLDRQKLVKELGDALWYLADTATKHSITLDEVAVENIKKLTGRYPAGFTVERSVNRAEERDAA